MKRLYVVCVDGQYTRDTQVIVPDPRMNDDDFDRDLDGEWTDASGSDLYLGATFAENEDEAIKKLSLGWEKEVLVAHPVVTS